MWRLISKNKTRSGSEFLLLTALGTKSIGIVGPSTQCVSKRFVSDKENKEEEETLEELSEKVKKSFEEVFSTTNKNHNTAADRKDAKSTKAEGEQRTIKNMTPEQRAKARETLIGHIISRDKEIFELKRQHELSMLRVEQHQKRILKDQEDRGMYYEQNMNVATFDTVSVGLYSQRSTLYHTMETERLRNFKLFLMVFCTILSCVYLYYRYMVNPDFEYVEEPIKKIGSKVGAYREIEWKHMTEEQRREQLMREANMYSNMKN